MSFYLCNGNNKKEVVFLGTFGSGSLSMSNLGYSAAQYTKWTMENFSYTINAGSVGKSFNGRTGYGASMGASLTPPSMNYVPETGILTFSSAIVYLHMYSYYGDGGKIYPGGGSWGGACSISIYLHT